MAVTPSIRGVTVKANDIICASYILELKSLLPIVLKTKIHKY